MEMEMIENLFLAFIPLFVAVDAIGILPIFVGLTQDLDVSEKRRIVKQSLWTALLLAFSFILLGKAVFKILGITIGDFMIAGGVILFCIAIIDLLVSGKKRRVPVEDIGSVPIGTPLIVGPGVLTTSLLLIDQYGILATAISVFINVMIAGLVFTFSDRLLKVFGPSGARAMSKIMALFLAAIAVMMIRKGILTFFYSIGKYKNSS